MSEGGTQVITESPNYKYERVRLETFQSWPANAKVEAWKMARAGLLYTGQGEEVRCIWCGVVMGEWQFGDQVMARHRQTSPQCPFVLQTSDNVPCDPISDNSVSVIIPMDTDDVGPQTPRLLSSVRSHLPPLDTSHHQEDASSASPEGPVEVDYRSEAVRLASFQNWNVPFIQPSDLAKAGFYSLNNLDSCKCVFCENCVGDWVEGDDPMTEHRNLFPMCPFVLGFQVGNIPLGEESQGEVPASPGHDEAGVRWNQQHLEPNSSSEKGGVSQLLGTESMGIMKHSGPLHPQYATLEARLRTFREWPPALKQTPKDLADAGFYYIGLSDQVKCFYCDGGLRNWQSEDEPWKEHARWFDKCVFVRLVKGDDYIKNCMDERPPEKANMSLQSGSRSVTEDDIRKAMSQAIVKQVLSMGIDHSRVKMAIKKRLENSGNPFDTAESLISAAFSVQRNQERRNLNENQNPSGAVLGGLGMSTNRYNDTVTERWEIGQEALTAVEEDLEETPQLFENTISLTPNPEVTPTVVGPSESVSEPSTPSISKTEEEKCPSLPLLDDQGEKKNVDLESENARLKEQRTCKICMDAEVCNCQNN